jgi:hypothetical protein
VSSFRSGKANDSRLRRRIGSQSIVSRKGPVELDPLYVDVIIRRYKAATGNPEVLVETRETFHALGVRRGTEAAPI